MFLKGKAAKAWLEANSKYFSYDELKCRCGCGQIKINTEHVNNLNALRTLADSALISTSSYRCPAHNEKVGGARASKHMDGIATDILTPTLEFQEELIRLARTLFGGVIAYHRKSDGARWIHVDSRAVPYFEDKR